MSGVVLPASRAFSTADLETLATVAPLRSFPVGSLLCVEGRPAQACLLLVSGEVEVRKLIDGKQAVVARLGPGELVGQLALFDGSARTATVAVRRDLKALVLERALFERLLGSHHPVALRFQKEVARSAVRQLRTATEQFAKLKLGLDREAAKGADAHKRARRKLRDSGAFVHAALSEISVDIHDLDKVQILVPEGQLRPGEERVRRRV